MHIFNSLALMARNETNQWNDHSMAEKSSNLIVVFKYVDTWWKSEIAEIKDIKHFQGVIVIDTEFGAARLLCKDNLHLGGCIVAFHAQNYIKAKQLWQPKIKIKCVIYKAEMYAPWDNWLVQRTLNP